MALKDEVEILTGRLSEDYTKQVASLLMGTRDKKHFVKYIDLCADKRLREVLERLANPNREHTSTVREDNGRLSFESLFSRRVSNTL